MTSLKFGVTVVCLDLALAAVPAAGQVTARSTAPSAPRQRVDVLTKGGSYLGVNVLEVDAEMAKAEGLKEERGVQITMVDSDSPASRSGLMVKDVILEYNGERVIGMNQFVRMVGETPVGRKVPLSVYRNGGMLTLTAQIGARPGQSFNSMWIGPLAPTPPSPAAPAAPMPPPAIDFSLSDIPSGLLGWQSSSLGYMSEPVDGQLAEFFGVKEGVLIRSVVAKSPAEKAGLKAGDVIIKADGSAVRSPREITGMLRRQREKKKVSLTVVRAHKELTLELIARTETKGDSLVL